MSLVDDKIQTISIVGLGKLGAPLAAFFAGKEYNVIGLDSDVYKVNLLKKGLAPVLEPGLDELIHKNQSRIKATQNYHYLVANSQVTFIVVPTPGKSNGAFSNAYVLNVIEKLATEIKTKENFHLVVVTSTLLPGTMENVILPELEKISGKTCGSGFGLCYNPQCTALGSVIQNLTNTDFVLIGESNSDAGQQLARMYRYIYDKKTSIARMNFINAELTKLAIHTFVATKISYGNMLSNLCENLPGADIQVITKTMGLDSRISKMNLQGTVGFGGPNFPRDNIAFRYFANQLNESVPIVEAADKVNRGQIPRLVDLIFSKLPTDGKVGVLGLSYKPDTDVIEESQGMKLVKWLLKNEIPVVVYDPKAMPNARELFLDKVTYAGSVEDCVKLTDVIVITTPWKEFKDIPVSALENRIEPPVIIDCWRILNKEKYQKYADYVMPGHGNLAQKSNRKQYDFEYCLSDLLAVTEIPTN